MMHINTYEIFNQIDKKSFTLYVEWFESHFKIMLFESPTQSLSGEMNTEDIEYFGKQLSKSSSEYLQETKEIFSGNDKDIQYSINDTTLEWKKNVWTLGRIKIYRNLDISVLSKRFHQLLIFYKTINNKLNILEEENKCLMDMKIKFSADIEKMIEIKTAMESDFYKKFMLILNSKKKKLRELQNLMKEKQSSKDSIFEACTDESDQSDEEDHKMNIPCTKSRKRKSINNSNSESMIKTKETNPTASTDSIINEKTFTTQDCANNKIQVSKDTNPATLAHESTHKVESCTSGTSKSRSSLSFIEESEEELFSQ